jgi:hypothetical protein
VEFAKFSETCHRIREADQFAESKGATPSETTLIESTLRWLSAAMENVFEVEILQADRHE